MYGSVARAGHAKPSTEVVSVWPRWKLFLDVPDGLSLYGLPAGPPGWAGPALAKRNGSLLRSWYLAEDFVSADHVAADGDVAPGIHGDTRVVIQVDVHIHLPDVDGTVAG